MDKAIQHPRNTEQQTTPSNKKQWWKEMWRAYWDSPRVGVL